MSTDSLPVLVQQCKLRQVFYEVTSKLLIAPFLELISGTYGGEAGLFLEDLESYLEKPVRARSCRGDQKRTACLLLPEQLIILESRVPPASANSGHYGVAVKSGVADFSAAHNRLLGSGSSSAESQGPNQCTTSIASLYVPGEPEIGNRQLENVIEQETIE